MRFLHYVLDRYAQWRYGPWRNRAIHAERALYRAQLELEQERRRYW